jgi:hypothetical protein
MAEKTVQEAIWTLIQSSQETNQAITESFVAAQERSRGLVESFFTVGMEVLKANQASAEKLVAAQERNRKLSQRFFKDGMEILKINQEAAESLVAAQEGNVKYAHPAVLYGWCGDSRASGREYAYADAGVGAAGQETARSAPNARTRVGGELYRLSAYSALLLSADI